MNSNVFFNTTHICRIYSSIENSYKSYTLYFLDVADVHSEYIVMDDNRVPYSSMNVDLIYRKSGGMKYSKRSVYCMDGLEIIGLAVPLHTRMIMTAEQAEAICLDILAHEDFNLENACSELAREDGMNTCAYQVGGSEKNPLIIRLFLASAGTYRKDRVKKITPKHRKDVYAMLPLPHFIWVCELYSAQSYAEGKIIGEIVLDGTASPNTQQESIILLQYPHRCCFKMPYENKDDLFNMFHNLISDWEPTPAFTGNLFESGIRPTIS